MSVFGRTSAQENHESPGFPTSRHLMGDPQGCQQLPPQFSPMASMTCATLERIVQALSTSNLFVSNFENWALRRNLNVVSTLLKGGPWGTRLGDRKSTRLNSSH